MNPGTRAAPGSLGWTEAREGARERLPRGSLLHLIPGRLAAHRPCGSRRLLGAGPAPSNPENTIPTTLAQGPEQPPSAWPPQGSARGAAPPLPHFSPRALGPPPERVLHTP